MQSAPVKLMEKGFKCGPSVRVEQVDATAPDGDASDKPTMAPKRATTDTNPSIFAFLIYFDIFQPISEKYVIYLYILEIKSLFKAGCIVHYSKK